MTAPPIEHGPRAPMRIRRMVVTTLLVTIISFLWTLVIPGIIASNGGVFYRDGILQKIPPAAKEQLKVFDEEQNRLKAQIKAVDDSLSKVTINEPAAVSGLLQLRNHSSELLRNSMPPISVIPFHLNPQLLLWPSIYISLGCLITIFVPSTSRNIRTLLRSSWFWTVGILIFVLYEWPLWMRNFVLSNDGRTVYAYPNFDIHPSSFVAQEFVIVGFCLLLSCLWFQRITYYSAVRSELKTNSSALQQTLRGDEGQQLREMFVQWQLESVVLALGFLFFTNFFWRLVSGYGDQRYLLSAILAHVLWATSWWLISLPVMIKWRHWSQVQRQAIVEIANADSSIDERRLKLDSLLNLQPLSSVNLSVSAIASAISFVLPIAQLFIR
jgi:hypothetical protein